MDPITECLKNKECQWSNAASQAFREIKVKMAKAPVLRYLDFTKVLVKNSMMLKDDILHIIKSFML